MQACQEFLPHSAALPVQPPWNGQPLPIEQVRPLSSPQNKVHTICFAAARLVGVMFQ